MPKAPSLLPLLALAAFTALTAGCATPSAPPPQKHDDSPAGQLASLVWMAGSWVGKTEEDLKLAPEAGDLWEAHYTTGAGGVLLGMTKRYRAGDCIFFEYETFGIEGGKLVVRPYLQGKPSDAFPLKSIDPAARRAVFENPENDPSTLDYWRFNDDTLVITVTSPSLKDGGKPQGFRLVLKRPRQ